MVNTQFSFTLDKKMGKMRAGTISTPHGDIQTPIFMPVGTAASVKALDARDITEAGSQIILANTYHLYLRPGTEVLQEAGGIHSFMQWSGPVLTDSGGFQVLSLGDAIAHKQEKGSDAKTGARITDDGVEFQSHLDGSKHFFSPQTSIQIQREIGSDIAMTFDEALPDSKPLAYARASLEKTHRWAKECFEYWQQHDRKNVFGRYQALFGIIQGGLFKELREQSAKYISSLDFDGVAVGGETVGYNLAGTTEVMEWIEHLLPQEKPRYAMGMGMNPIDLVEAVKMGFDMFDCVAPTRLARNGSLYVGKLEEKDGLPVFVSAQKNGRTNISTVQYTLDNKPIQEDCDCYTCKSGYSRSYLRHLYKAGELSYYRLASIHNVRSMVRLSQQLRQFILEQSKE